MIKSQPKASSAQKQTCRDHNLAYTHICLAEDCVTRRICRKCKLDHPENHLRSLFTISEVYSGDFFNSIDSIIQNQKEILQKKVNDKAALMKKINTVFMDLQNEIEKVLIETKTEMIHKVDRFYQELKTDYSEENFHEIQSSLKNLCNDFKKEEPSEFSTSLELFSRSYLKTLESINSGIKLATQFENNELEVQDILDLVKSSCNTLLTKSTLSPPDEKLQISLRKQTTKTAPQEITCMEHCDDLGFFVTGGVHGLLTLWDSQNFSCVSQFQIHEGAIDLMVYLPKSQTLVTTSKDNYLNTIRLAQNGSVQKSFRMKAQKTVRGLVGFGMEDRIATVSEQGKRLRIWDVENDLVQACEVEIVNLNTGSKILYIEKDKTIAVSYSKGLLFCPLTRQSELSTLLVEDPLLFSCYVQETETIHGLLEKNEKYEEIIWRKSQDGYSLLSRKEIDTTKVQGKAIGMIADASTILLVFTHSFILRRALVYEETVKFVELLCQSCPTENKTPICLIESEEKVLINKEGRKMEIYNFM